jgi:hypothetical protein
MDNQQKLATLGSQDTRRKNTTQKSKKDEQQGPHQETGVNPDARDG